MPVNPVELLVPATSESFFYGSLNAERELWRVYITCEVSAEVRRSSENTSGLRSAEWIQSIKAESPDAEYRYAA